jgi:hypothetical protein
MKYLKTFNKFIIKINESGKTSNELSAKYRMQSLAKIEVPGLESKYCILISVGEQGGLSLITEYEKYQSFKKTTNRYLKHPENSSIPVKTHYHIYPNNGENEIYEVNMDCTAHHKKNRGYEVPEKEAGELMKLGVKIPKNRIIENKQVDFSNIELDKILLLIE